jgi:hypothetical protein
MTTKQSQRYYDEHTLYIRSGFLSQTQVERAVNGTLQQLRDVYKNDKHWGPLINKATCIVNVVTNTKGDMFRLTYARVSEPAVYHILLGRNPDGSERVEEYDDPSWTGSTEFKRQQTPSGMVKWGDIQDFEEEQDVLEKSYQCPKLRRVLPPIAELALTRLSEDQQHREYEWLVKQAQDQGKNQAEIDKIETPRFGILDVQGAFVEDTQPDEKEHILCCRIAPEWITVDMIRDKFTQFNTDDRYHIIKVKKKDMKITYPTFNIGEKINENKRQDRIVRTRMIYVTFSPYTKNASFALHMCKKFDITNTKTGEKALLIFSHWRETKSSDSYNPAHRNFKSNQNYNRKGDYNQSTRSEYARNRDREFVADQHKPITPSVSAWRRPINLDNSNVENSTVSQTTSEPTVSKPPVNAWVARANAATTK